MCSASVIAASRFRFALLRHKVRQAIDATLDDVAEPRISRRRFGQDVQGRRVRPPPRVVFSWIELRSRKVAVDLDKVVALESRNPCLAPLPLSDLLLNDSQDPTGLLSDFARERLVIGLPVVDVTADDVPSARR